ncbi:MAG: type II toxin-antitoxin system HicB family antitoxin [Oscillospiraceae bacterium]|jgi:predicted RNase H-like HicB family nuclease|nr:type II toxin-antitoxin system HicB family antitoxin [Oscillospiraceae bacterium]
MRKITYYAVFEPTSDGSFGVYWPDLPGCTSYGSTLLQAGEMALEALELHISGMEEDGECLPLATLPPFAEVPAGGIVKPVTVYREIIENKFDKYYLQTAV